MPTIIKIQNLRKIYPIGRERVIALNGINLEIERGQICCILGTSGSGKSTLLNQLAGLEKPTKGCVVINGTNISQLSESKLAKFRQKNVGFVFQSYNLLAAYSAMENVAMPLMFRGVGRRKRNKLALKMLKAVGLGKRLHHKPAQMSGGQQQRVGIARAFVARPKIVFADEPTGNLDTKTTKEVMELMVNLCRKYNQTLVLVTHDRDLALYADRIITLIDGNIVDDKENESIARTIEQIKADKEKAAKQQEEEKEEEAARIQFLTEGTEKDESEELEEAQESIDTILPTNVANEEKPMAQSETETEKPPIFASSKQAEKPAEKIEEVLEQDKQEPSHEEEAENDGKKMSEEQ